MVQLHSLLQSIPRAEVRGSRDACLSDICYDSRLVGPGSLFVAMPSVGGDARSGGFSYLAQAVEDGAAAVVVQCDPGPLPVTAIVVPDARAALADLACQFFGHPSRQLHLYAVTGTDGKTTTTYLFEQILAYAGYTTGLIGTVEIKIGDRRVNNTDRMTTPESLDIQRLLRQMVDCSVTHAVVEASSHALALQRLRGCRLAGCGFTNITADHIEFHGSPDAYFEAKASLFTDLGRGVPAVLNRDDPRGRHLAQMASGPVLSYSVHGDAQVLARDIRSTEHGSHCVVRTDGGEVETFVPLPGLFNVSNALAAIGLALVEGLPLQVIAEGLSRSKAPPGRLQRVEAGQPYRVLVDYAHTPNAFRAVLRSLREQTKPPHQLIAVFGAAGNRDRAKRPLLAQIARQYADFFVITNEDPFGERPTAIMQEIANGVDSSEEGVRYERIEDRETALRRAIDRAQPGDTVVVLGKGHEQSIVVDGRKVPWNDMAMIRGIVEGST